MGRYTTVGGGGWHPGIRLEHMSYILYVWHVYRWFLQVKCCWFVVGSWGVWGWCCFALFFSVLEGLWNGFLRHNLNHPLVGNHLVIGWIRMCNVSTNRCEDWSLWWGWQRSRCSELICWKTHSVIQCFRWEKKDPGARFLQANGNMKDSTKNTWDCSTFDTIQLFSPTLAAIFPSSAAERLEVDWPTQPVNPMRCHPIRTESHPNGGGTWKSHHPNRQLGPLHFASSILLRTGGRLFH